MIRMSTAILVLLYCSVAQASGVAVYEFSSRTCGPCQRVAPVVEKLHREGLPIQQFDVAEDQALAAKFGIRSVPTFVMVVNDQEVERRSGYISESELRSWIEAAQSSAGGISETALNQSGIQLGEAKPFRTEADNTAGTVRGAIEELRSSNRDSSQLASQSNSGAIEFASGFTAAESGVSSIGRLADDPMDSSVRIRVIINGNINLGSGTVISSLPGRTIILSCWHIFRDFQPESKIEVDFIKNGQAETNSATVLQLHQESDLSVIVVDTPQSVPVSPVASPAHAATVGHQVVTVGCSGGELPTRKNIEVTAVDRYNGPNNLECTGLPVQGRSGGGLFNNLGEVVGVCIAADRDRVRGLYSGLLAIHEILEKCQLEHLYLASPENSLLADTPPPAKELPRIMPETPNPFPDVAGQETPTPPAAAAPPVDLRSGDSEVVVIIRDQANPQNPNRIVIIHDPSKAFFDHLDAEFGGGIGSDVQAATPRPLNPIARAVRVPFQDHNILLSRELRDSADPSRLVPTSLSKPVAPERYVRTRR